MTILLILLAFSDKEAQCELMDQLMQRVIQVRTKLFLGKGVCKVNALLLFSC